MANIIYQAFNNHVSKNCQLQTGLYVVFCKECSNNYYTYPWGRVAERSKAQVCNSRLALPARVQILPGSL